MSFQKIRAYQCFFLDGLKNALQTYKLTCKVLYGNIECNNHTKKKTRKQAGPNNHNSVKFKLQPILSS